MSLAPIILPRINTLLAIVDDQGRPTVAFKLYLDTLAKNLETAFNAIITNVNDLTAVAAATAAAAASAATANAAAATANTAAATANTAATTANTTATAITNLSTLANSTTTGLTITATDMGANVTVDMTAHTRTYGNGTAVAVNAGSVAALAYSTQYFVYYDQASRAGGAVTYVATTTATTAQTSSAFPNRHYVGSVVTPAALGAPIGGTGAVAPTFEAPPGGFWP